MVITMELECSHTLNFEPPLPLIGEKLWCLRCKEYVKVGPTKEHKVKSYYASWVSEPDRGSIRGTCTREGCGYTLKRTSWYAVRDLLERHEIMRHTVTSLIRTVDLEGFHVRRKRISRAEPPPF